MSGEIVLILFLIIFLFSVFAIWLSVKTDVIHMSSQNDSQNACDEKLEKIKRLNSDVSTARSKIAEILNNIEKDHNVEVVVSTESVSSQSMYSVVKHIIRTLEITVLEKGDIK